MLLVDRLLYPITSLGYGARVCLWVRGCSIRCPACASRDLWDSNGGVEIDERNLAEHVAGIVTTHQLDGLTITGGEPTDQIDAIIEFGRRFRELVSQRHSDSEDTIDLLVYTGREKSQIEEHYSGLFSISDALICGPYCEDEPSDDFLFGSANQEKVFITDLGHARYSRVLQRRSIQFVVDGKDITFAGVTGQGDLLRIEEALRSKGIVLGRNSWTIK